ncbi:pao retrotransposon peptidase [Lasius niger]|uniref:Pao retrotransposon peptidase n=1 Tax=Lasius niger TaxID=67767 RepID=A0A0J7N7J3_LASNI|nr:pao retrotransposon peptidase [Lasius niger]
MWQYTDSLHELTTSVNRILTNKVTHEVEEATTSFFTMFNFPLQDEEDLIRVDEHLNDEKNFNVAMNKLAKIGGSSVQNFTQRALQILITNDLASTYSWLGRRAKKTFNKLKLADLIIEARTLGLTWHPASDSFKSHVSRSDAIVKLTKRSILSKIAQLFDPLGWLASVTILGKMFIQQLWKLNIKWDDPLPPSLAQQWNRYDADLRGVSEYSIPRWLGTSTSTQGFEFHGFSDSSQDALGAVLYIRTIQTFADAKVTLLVAKSKAPLKKQTIPRLEL